MVEALISQDNHHSIFTTSREPQPSRQSQHHFITDNSETSITSICEQLETELNNEQLSLETIIITLGTLHGDGHQPEKRLEDFCPQTFSNTFYINSALPMLWLSGLLTILRKQNNCKVVVLSARIGSIGDNQLGGWYSYRASKAALNMLLQTASIELARRAKGVKLVAFHPGTTDSPLSRPFQANVPEGKLFTAEFVAHQLLDIAKQQPLDGALSYVDWQGKTIDW